MNARLTAIALVSAVTLAVVVAGLLARSTNACVDGSSSAACGQVSTVVVLPGTESPPSPTVTFFPLPSVRPSESPTPSATPDPSPSVKPPVITFDDEFGGSTLGEVWGVHWPPFSLAGWSRSHAIVANGVLTIRATRVGSTWTSSLIDTTGWFRQRYGTFSARIRITEGKGLWPAFWLAQPPSPSHGLAEGDVMEVCANPPGEDGGNDVTVLHNVIHKVDGHSAFSYPARVGNLAGGWHVYTLDWRAGSMTFYLDGVEVSHYAGSDVPSVGMVIVLDLAVGGRWCGPPDSTTPTRATMQVDWVRATR
jgi:beta-glucanase (GH16 family)